MLFHRPCAIDKISEIKNFSWSWAVRICLCITTLSLRDCIQM